MPYSLGLLRQKPDPRDRVMFSPRAVTDILPDEFDLSVSEKFGGVPQLNQGALGSCGPNTASEDIMNDQLVQGLALSPASRLFVYWVTREIMGTINQDSGVDNRTMLKALNKRGFCPETMWPYRDDLMSMVQRPSPDCFAAALSNCITSYAAVSISLSQLQGALYTIRRPVLFGFSVFPQIQSAQAAQTGWLTVPGPFERPIGGHDVSLVGWSNSQKAFKFRNHWMNGARPWGDNGYGWIPYDYATNPNLASDCWVINAVPGGVPIPPPTPVPPPPAPVPPPTPPPSPTPSPHPDTSLLRNIGSILGWHSHEPAAAGDPISFYK